MLTSIWNDKGGLSTTSKSGLINLETAVEKRWKYLLTFEKTSTVRDCDIYEKNWNDLMWFKKYLNDNEVPVYSELFDDGMLKSFSLMTDHQKQPALEKDKEETNFCGLQG